MTHKHRVAITGIGLVSPLGNSTQDTWQAVLSGKSGITHQDRYPMPGYPCQVAGLVRGEQELLDAALSLKHQTKTDRFIHLALIAGREAMIHAGLSTQFPNDRTRFGSYVGVGIGGLASIGQAVLDLHEHGYKKVSPFVIPKSINNQAAGWLSMQWDLQGPSLALTSACASSGDAIGVAFRAIKDGYADYMLTGGTESCVVPVAIAGFGNMRALSTWTGDPKRASRPFDKQRSGFVMAEGAAMLVLERMDLAVARGADIVAEIVGYGATSDAHHITAMHPEGRGAVSAINLAMHEAGLTINDIGYVNAHGTSTLMNDQVETMVIKKVFGDLCAKDYSDHLLVSSTKSMTGHMLGAAGAAEAAFTALALRDGMFPPTINLDDPDPLCDLDYIPHTARKATVQSAISNSFGFGGSNAVLAIKKV